MKNTIIKKFIIYRLQDYKCGTGVQTIRLIDFNQIIIFFFVLFGLIFQFKNYFGIKL
jgi:hypothetical protein